MHHLQRRLTQLLGDGSVKDDDLRKVKIDVVDVDVTRDRRRAMVTWDYVPGLGEGEGEGGGETGVEVVDRALNRAAPYIRSLLSKGLATRHVPELVFIRDKRPQEEESVDQLAVEGLPDDLARLLSSQVPDLEVLLAQDERDADQDRLSAEMAATPWLFENLEEEGVVGEEAAEGAGGVEEERVEEVWSGVKGTDGRWL